MHENFNGHTQFICAHAVYTSFAVGSGAWRYKFVFYFDLYICNFVGVILKPVSVCYRH